MIEWHLEETMVNCNPFQLLMQIHGKGGTGKSKIIRTVTKLFKANRVSGMITRSAYTGIAASIFDGKTSDTLAGLPLNGGMPSDAAVHQVAILTILRQYLVFNKISMISEVFCQRCWT